jgi:hypothetical protein
MRETRYQYGGRRLHQSQSWVTTMGLLTLGLMAATVVVYGASLQQYQGHAWADGLCSAAPFLCSSPDWLGVVTVAVSIVYFYRLSLNA